MQRRVESMHNNLPCRKSVGVEVHILFFCISVTQGESKHRFNFMIANSCLLWSFVAHLHYSWNGRFARARIASKVLDYASSITKKAITGLRKASSIYKGHLRLHYKLQKKTPIPTRIPRAARQCFCSSYTLMQPEETNLLSSLLPDRLLKNVRYSNSPYVLWNLQINAAPVIHHNSKYSALPGRDDVVSSIPPHTARLPSSYGSPLGTTTSNPHIRLHLQSTSIEFVQFSTHNSFLNKEWTHAKQDLTETPTIQDIRYSQL